MSGSLPPAFVSLLERLEASAWGTMVRETLWGYPIFEILHLVGIATVVGSIAMMDLRLLGRTSWLPVRATASWLLGATWTGFALVVVSGLSLFSAYATSFVDNPVFRWKLLLIAIAGINAATFHATAFRGVDGWDANAPTPLAARVSGALSLLLWFTILALGRWIAYVE